MIQLMHLSNIPLTSPLYNIILLLSLLIPLGIGQIVCVFSV